MPAQRAGTCLAEAVTNHPCSTMGHTTATARVAAHIRSAVGTTWLGHGAATAPRLVLTSMRVHHLQHLPPASRAFVSRTRRSSGRALWVWSGAVQSGAVTRRGRDRPPKSRNERTLKCVI